MKDGGSRPVYSEWKIITAGVTSEKECSRFSNYLERSEIRSTVTPSCKMASNVNVLVIVALSTLLCSAPVARSIEKLRCVYDDRPLKDCDTDR